MLDRLLNAENGRAAHTVQRFYNDIAVLSQNALSCAFIARYQRFRRRDVAKLRAVYCQFFITVAQALRFVDDQRPFLFSAFQNIGRINKLGIKRRSLRIRMPIAEVEV